MPDALSFLSVCGMLGYGYPLESLQAGMRASLSFLGVDAGSADPGPYYLGSGRAFVQPAQVRRDLEPALLAARRHDVPLIIGSAGGGGAAPHVDAFLAIVRDIARRHGLHFRLAVIHADIDRDIVTRACRAGRVRPCGPVPPLGEEAVADCAHIVGQMGTGPLIRALAGGADVVVAGRCCDAAIFAALPIMRGFDTALSLHCGKIAECGALCAQPAAANDALLATLHPDCFIVRPADQGRRCTPASVAAHSLYEQPDPDCFFEPEGKVDLSACEFEPCDQGAVRVSGTRLVPADTTAVKLEGVALRGFRAVTIGGIRDPLAIASLDAIEAGVREAVARNLEGIIAPQAYALHLRRYGIDAVTPRDGPGPVPPPREVGLVIESIAPTQALADTVLSLARSTALHQSFPGRKATAGNLAFPFSPSDLQGGPVYAFTVYHLLETDEPDALFPVSFEDV